MSQAANPTHAAQVLGEREALLAAAIRAHCRELRIPTVAAQCLPLSQAAAREGTTHLAFLEALLSDEVQERCEHAVANRLRDARLPRFKTLEEFDFNTAGHLNATQLRTLADGAYIERGEPVLLLGDCGTGKTHLATGLCVAACRQRKRARFTTAAALVNELVEAQHTNQLARVLRGWNKLDLIVLDEVGYVPLAEQGAELLFQVVAERAERAALIVTTNLPFSEWTQVFPNPRLCKAMLDRLTDRAHIIETGTDSYRFKRTLGNKMVGARAAALPKANAISPTREVHDA
jgi:DNA replication protein DnaC